MPRRLEFHEDRLFPFEPTVRAIARDLYGEIRDLPILSPHGHTDPLWFASDAPFGNATDLLLAPDHYLFRMLYSQGVRLADLGVPARGRKSDVDPRSAWRLFASHFHLFDGTPSSLWLNYVFVKIFELDVVLEESTADLYYDTIGAALATAAF